MSKVVFVGNVPYNMGEEQLIDVFKSVGQVVGFRLVFDRDTGKAKGYGFCEFADHETALSAVRNLNNTDVGGRPLRIDLADSDPFLEGKTTVRGEILDGGYPGPAEPRSGWRSRSDDSSFMSNLPPGKTVPPGMSTLDAISQTLAAIPPSQVLEVLAQIKAFIITHPDQAKTLLQKQPQLSYALFQALVLHNIVPAEVILKMHGGVSEPARPPVAQTPPLSRPPMGPPPVPAPHMQHAPPFPPPHGMPPFPPGQSVMSGYPPSGVPPYYRGPPGSALPPAAVPPPIAQPPPSTPTMAPAPAIPDDQREMIMLVLSMSPEAINALPEAQRASVMQIRNSFAGALQS